MIFYQMQNLHLLYREGTDLLYIKFFGMISYVVLLSPFSFSPISKSKIIATLQGRYRDILFQISYDDSLYKVIFLNALLLPQC